jgi:hypothetical protein
MGRRSRTRLTMMVAALAIAAVLGTSVVAARGSDEGRGLAAVRAATAGFHDLNAAVAADYEEFYVCTDREGTGAMGQHYVNFALLANAAIDPLRPESLVYEPRRGGGYNFVGVEWIVFKAEWDASHAGPPALFGQEFATVSVPNRYGVPAPFYELHAWIWKPNPRGMFDDWNPRVSCRGDGDAAI